MLLVDRPAPGAWNMAVDEALLEAAAAESIVCLRFYRWEAPTLSLGYFQAFDDRAQHAASAGCPVVRRLSGGGAIVHDRELTYSFVVPADHRWARARQRLYHEVHASLQAVLAALGVVATVHGDRSAAAARSESSQTTSAEAMRAAGVAEERTMPFLCFQRRSPGDLVVGPHKIAGSAQRRWRGAILQHGSLIVERSPAAPELEGLRALLPEGNATAGRSAVSVDDLQAAWQAELGRRLGLEWLRGRLWPELGERAEHLMADRYASDDWTVRRARR